MKLYLVSAALPPQLDGIGDYTACLAAELARSQDVTVLVGAPSPAPLPGVCIETAFSAGDPVSVWGIEKFVKTNPPDWVLLQYNPFSYGQWGRNPHLPRVMQQIKRACPQTRFALMVHEPFVPLTSWQFAVMAIWQRRQLRRLGQAADIVFFSIDPWVKRFKYWFPKKPVVHLPVGSNIPRVPISRREARARLGIREETIVLGLFGTMSAGRMPGLVRDAALALAQSGRPVQVLYIGPHQAQVGAALGGADIIAGGPAPAEEVSRRFAAMDIYLLPYTDGISTRRTTLMTALQHGIATVGTHGLLTDALLERAAGDAFLLADVYEQEEFIDAVTGLAESPKQRLRLGQAAEQLYEREFDWKKLTARIFDALKSI